MKTIIACFESNERDAKHECRKGDVLHFLVPFDCFGAPLFWCPLFWCPLVERSKSTQRLHENPEFRAERRNSTFLKGQVDKKGRNHAECMIEFRIVESAWGDISYQA